MLTDYINYIPSSNWMDDLCNLCIDIMYSMSEISGLTYGQINVLLFVILQPLLILLLFSSTAIATFCKKRWSRKYAIGSMIATVVVFVFTALLLSGAIINIFGYFMTYDFPQGH